VGEWNRPPLPSTQVRPATIGPSEPGVATDLACDDDANRVETVTNAEGTTTYTYDATDQLTAADRPGTSDDESYSYDLAGNRTMTGYTTDTGNRLTASPNATYSYDAEGNLEAKTDTTNDHVTTYAYDHRNRLVGVTEKDDTDAVVMQATYTYDALDRRIATEVDDDGAGPNDPVTRWTVYDGQNPYADFDGSGDFDTRYRVLMEAMTEPVLFVSIGSGKITDANAAAAARLGLSREEAIGTALAQEFDGKRRGAFVDSLTQAALTEGAGPVTATTKRSGETVRLHPFAFRAAGERMLLLRLSETGEDVALQTGLAADLQALFAEGVDGIVFTDADGVIRSANDAFLSLTDMAHVTAVKGRSLAQFLARGTVDLKVLLENAERVGQMRMYATKLSSSYGSSVSVEISATHLTDRAHPA